MGAASGSAVEASATPAAVETPIPAAGMPELEFPCVVSVRFAAGRLLFVHAMPPIVVLEPCALA